MKLLCVDDNSKQRQIIELMLAATGIEVDFAENGQDAVEAYQVNQYDAVLMDIEMPVKSGLEAAREIRQVEDGFHLGYTPILFISANGSDQESHCEREAGGDGHLAKPFTADRLIGALNHVLHRAEGYAVQNRLYSTPLYASN